MSELTAVLVIVVIWSALFVLAVAESALNGMTRSRANALLEDGVDGADRLVAGLQDRALLLAPILALALGAQLSVGAIVAWAVDSAFGAAWIPVGILVALFVMFVITEAVPKVWALANIDRAAITSAKASAAILAIPPLRWLIKILLGGAGVFLRRTHRSSAAVSSEEEIVALADAAVAAEVLEEDEGEIIHSLLDFGDTVVREVMVPRPDVLAVSHETTIDDAIVQMADRGVSRMPIYGDDIDDVRGVVHIKDLFSRVQRGRGGHFVSIALRPPTFIPESKRAAELLRELKGIPTSLVIVIDEYGGTAGIITVEDLIEEFIGEIVDEFDYAEEPMFTAVKPGVWRVLARVPIEDFNESLDAELADDDWDTLGGMLLDGIGHVPAIGESFRTNEFEFMIESIDGRRITRVLVKSLRSTTTSDPSSGLISNG